MSDISDKQRELGTLADDATVMLDEAGVGYVVIVADTGSGARAMATNIPAEVLDNVLKSAIEAPFTPGAVKFPAREETN
jgi:hypothetical protein